jgi:hypothetical protein
VCDGEFELTTSVSHTAGGHLTDVQTKFVISIKILGELRLHSEAKLVVPRGFGEMELNDRFLTHLYRLVLLEREI